MDTIALDILAALREKECDLDMLVVETGYKHTPASLRFTLNALIVVGVVQQSESGYKLAV